MTNRFIKLVQSLIYREDKSETSVYVKKILAQHRNKKPLYDEFRLVVHNLLDAFLKESNYKYQITSRTKTPERLREKLIRKNEENVRYKFLTDIEDLAGVRVLFYSEADKDRFVRELKNDLDVTMEIREKKQKNGYEATHIIMTFGEKRLRLPEYKHFSGLKVEIQITSILRHTWAEIEHDFIYKDISGLKKRDPKKFAIVEKKLSEILEKHIKQASREFEEIIKLVDEQ